MAYPHGGEVLGSLCKECGYRFVWVQAIEHVGHAWVQASPMWVSAFGAIDLIESGVYSWDKSLLSWSGARWPWRLLSLARASPPSRAPPSELACRVCVLPTRRCPLWDWAQFPPCLLSFPPPQMEFPSIRLQAPHWQVSSPYHIIIMFANSQWIMYVNDEFLLSLHIQKCMNLQSILIWVEGLNGRSHGPPFSYSDELPFKQDILLNKPNLWALCFLLQGLALSLMVFLGRNWDLSTHAITPGDH